MGLDLTLLPTYSAKPGCDISVDVLRMEADSELFEAIRIVEDLKGVHVQRSGIKSYLGSHGDECCWGDTEETPYGERMKSLTSQELSIVLAKHISAHSFKNKAVLAFIKELPPDSPVYLYWN